MGVYAFSYGIKPIRYKQTLSHFKKGQGKACEE